jgi:hypothetical protein
LSNKNSILRREIYMNIALWIAIGATFLCVFVANNKKGKKK